MAGNFKDGFWRKLIYPSIDGFCMCVMIFLYKVLCNNFFRVKQKLNVSSRKSDKIKNDFIITLAKFLIFDFLVPIDWVKCELTVLGTNQLFYGIVAIYFLQ